MWIQPPRIVKSFLNCLESCNINQHAHKPTHLHGHILDLILTPDVLSDVLVSEFISDHALVLGYLDFTKSSIPKSRNVTFPRYHKIKMDSLRSDLANCSFVKCPGNTASVLYEQYINDLNNLLDKHTLRCLALSSKVLLNGSQILICWQRLSGTSSNAYGTRINHHKIELDCVSRLPIVVQ